METLLEEIKAIVGLDSDSAEWQELKEAIQNFAIAAIHDSSIQKELFNTWNKKKKP